MIQRALSPAVILASEISVTLAEGVVEDMTEKQILRRKL